MRLAAFSGGDDSGATGYILLLRFNRRSITRLQVIARHMEQ